MEYSEKLELIKDMAACLGGLSVGEAAANDAGILDFMNRHFYGIFSDPGEQDSFLALFHQMQPEIIYEVESRLSAFFLVLKCPEKETFWLIGPCLTEVFSDAFLYRVIRATPSLSPLADILRNHYQRMPHLPLSTLQRLGTVLARHLYGRDADFPYIRKKDPGNSRPDHGISLVPDYQSLLPMRLLESRYELSAAIIEAVKHGNYSLARRLYEPLLADIRQIRRSRSPLRDAQNLCIIMNSMFRYAADQSGVHPYLLDKTSHEIGLEIEKLQTYEKLQVYSEEILKRYCTLIQENACPNVHPFIREAVTYIKANLSNPLSVKAFSASLHVNPDYFSHLFRTEMGITFSGYVNRERIQQAASLLARTQLPVQQISSAVGYNNANYFAKQFRNYMGVSPQQYRKLHAAQ